MLITKHSNEVQMCFLKLKKLSSLDLLRKCRRQMFMGNHPRSREICFAQKVEART